MNNRQQPSPVTEAAPSGRPSFDRAAVDALKRAADKEPAPSESESAVALARLQASLARTPQMPRLTRGGR